ncbi:hypothetical protein [uncultured Serinicoccus sp.]|nr:hypothetical protein [uncultured Serinicoccus sp.]
MTHTELRLTQVREGGCGCTDEGVAISWDYRVRGPEAWTLRFTRAS